MRPIELIVEGFTSFRSRQVLDFSNLDLFAITGATGAGKTSLLDAITFALYDKVSQKPNSSRELVSQGAAQMKVELRFVMRQTEYRIVRTWRNRGKTDEKKFLFDKLIGEDWERCDRNEKLEDIIGMDFETFTRVIILPQGQFDEFLKGEASKRREILRQLAGFQIFEQMRKEAGDRTSRFKAEREGLEKVLAGIQAPTKEELQQQQTELENLEVSIPELDIKVKNSRKLWELEEKLFAQIQQHQTLSVKLDRLCQDASRIQSLEIKLRNAQLANSIVETWAILRTNRQRLQTAIAELSKTTQHLEITKRELDQQQQIFAEFRSDLVASQAEITTQERNLAIAESLHIQQQQSQTELDRACKNVTERSQILAKCGNSQKQSELELQTTTNTLEKLKKAIASSSKATERLENLRESASLLAQWQILKTNLTKQQHKYAQLQTENNQLMQKLAEKQNLITKAERKFEAVNIALSEAEFSNSQALQSNHVNALRSELNDRDNCPVCHNIYLVKGLPEITQSELIDTKNLVSQRLVNEHQLLELRDAKIKIEANLGTSTQQLQDYSIEMRSLETEISQLLNQINSILENHRQIPWIAENLLRERQELERQELAYQKLISDQQEIMITYENQKTKLNTNQESFQLAEIESTKAEQERSHRQAQLQKISQDLLEVTAGQSYETLRQTILQAKSQLSDRLQRIESNYQKARENFVKLEVAAIKSQENHQLIIAECAKQESNWQAELQKTNFTESQFIAAQVMQSQIDRWQTEITNYRQQQQELTTRLQIISEAIADQDTNQQAIANLREQSQQAEQHFQLANENRASIKAWLEQAKQKLQESEQLELQKMALQTQEQTYYTLAQDLQSHKFQEYILDTLQQELAYRASVLLQLLSSDRYILQIESGDYWVSDNWNGGEKRRVKTLSGGETFAASLSMALALSERLSMGIELGSLFLDEGFGTLDSETLESVTQILESLRQQNRLIGVITHIQSLADRLPAQIYVRKSINGSELVNIIS
jgi:exonuclease SbcC